MKTKMIPLIAVLFFAGAVTNPLSALDTEKPESGVLKIIPRIELGYLGVLSHLYRVGKEADGNSNFNFITQGGQDILFPYSRLWIDTVLWNRHRVSFLYQPLTVSTRTVSGRNGTGPIQIDGVNFGTNAVNIIYGFDFYRVSYTYDFIANGVTELCAGLSIQIRNANIVFESLDGSLRTVQNNIGIVPILKLRFSHWFFPLLGVEFDGDGFYASSAFFNGASRPFEGWIWDAAVSLKTRLVQRTTAFLTVRSIGGGANGSNAYDNVAATKSTLSETYNALATIAVTAGFSIDLDL